VVRISITRLVLGGTTPLVLTVLVALRLPESVRFMVRKRR
jgi:hypothetical protein